MRWEEREIFLSPLKIGRFFWFFEKEEEENQHLVTIQRLQHYNSSPTPLTYPDMMCIFSFFRMLFTWRRKKTRKKNKIKIK